MSLEFDFIGAVFITFDVCKVKVAEKSVMCSLNSVHPLIASSR